MYVLLKRAQSRFLIISEMIVNITSAILYCVFMWDGILGKTPKPQSTLLNLEVVPHSAVWNVQPRFNSFYEKKLSIFISLACNFFLSLINGEFIYTPKTCLKINLYDLSLVNVWYIYLLYMPTYPGLYKFSCMERGHRKKTLEVLVKDVTSPESFDWARPSWGP